MHKNAQLVMAMLVLSTACGPWGCEKKTATPAPAQQEAQETNAGPEYLRLAAQLDPALEEKVRSSGKSPDAALNQALLANAGVIDGVIQASKLPECDFGERYSVENTGRPGLRPVRLLARLLNEDAKRCLAGNDVEGAAARGAAVLRMMHHMAAGAECYVDLLVACSLGDMGCELAEEVATRGVTGAAKDELKAAARWDGFASAGRSMGTDARVMAATIREKPEEISSFLPDFARATPQEREAAAAALERFADELESAWKLHDGAVEEALAKVPAVVRVLADPGKLRKKVRETERRVIDVRKRLA